MSLLALSSTNLDKATVASFLEFIPTILTDDDNKSLLRPVDTKIMI